jgi:FAD/FMN-containing dehydrogenase
MTSMREALSAAFERENGAVVHLRDVHSPQARQRGLEDAIFNGAVDLRPLAVVECADEAAVRAALRVAAEYAVPVSVLAGGHDLSGRAFDERNLVLDLRPMSRVQVASAAGEVTVGGGALTRHLLAALPDDLVTVTGTMLSVGVTGLTLAGGYGRLNSRFGLASDCMRGARVVLADGSLVMASERDDADLFWALRGGGSGFGVVTTMTMALHSLPLVLTAMILYPLDRAKDTLLHAQDLLDRHPVELSLFMGFMTAATAEPMLFLAPLWSGDSARGERLLQTLEAVGGARVVQRRWGSYQETFDEQGEKAWPKGRHYHLLTQTLRRIDETAAEILLEGARGMTSPTSAIVLHDFHGAPTRMAPDATAFPLREDHYVVEVIGAWDCGPADDGAQHKRWAEDLSDNLATIAVPGGYVNLISPSEGERVRLFYGSSTQRLIEVKRRVDPNDLFRSGIGRVAS